jgi:4-carboxymuconolactone decarboxylase
LSLSEDQQSLYDRIRKSHRASDPRPYPITDANGDLVGPFKPLLLSPVIGGAIERLGNALRTPTTLSPRAREISILLVAAHEHCAYEWEIHAHRAALLGIDEVMLERLSEVDPTTVTDASERTVAELTIHLIEHGSTQAEALRSFEQQLSAATVFEVIALTGYYRLLADLSNFGQRTANDLTPDHG